MQRAYLEMNGEINRNKQQHVPDMSAHGHKRMEINRSKKQATDSFEKSEGEELHWLA